MGDARHYYCKSQPIEILSEGRIETWLSWLSRAYHTVLPDRAYHHWTLLNI